MDVFGFTKTTHAQSEISSPSTVLVSVGGNVHLVQSCSIRYARTVTPVHELGSEDVWMSAGPGAGTCSLTRAVGAGRTLLDGFSSENRCGTQTITIGGVSNDCAQNPGMLRCVNALLADVGMSASVGEVFITDSATFNVGSVEKV